MDTAKNVGLQTISDVQGVNALSLSKHMKILLVTNNYEPIISGLAVSIKGYVRNLMMLGHEVYVVAPEYPGHVDDNPKIIRVPSLKIYYKAKYPISTPIISYHRLKMLIRQLGIEVIHSHHPFGIGKTALLAAKKLQKPILFTYHTMYECYAHYIPFLPQKTLERYLIWSSLNYANKCDIIITPSKFVEALLVRRGCMPPIRLLPSGISEELLDVTNLESCGALRNKYRIDADDVVCLCVTRLAEEKNCLFLLTGFSKVIKKLPTAKLLIVGDGPSKSNLIEACKKLKLTKNVVFCGAVPHDKLRTFYMTSQMLLFVSKTETQGLPLVEAMHFGLPSVALKSGASQEFVGDLKTGILTPSDTDEFSSAVLSLASNQKKLNRYKVRNKYIAMSYKHDRQLCLLDSIYNEAVLRHTRKG